MTKSGAVLIAAAVVSLPASAAALAQGYEGAAQNSRFAAPVLLAQAMTDPTRPPADYLPGVAGEPAQAPAGQIVVISRDRKFVTINGETVALGGRYRDSRVVSISDDEVVLQGRSGTETIRLYSAVNKTMRRTNEGVPPVRTPAPAAKQRAQ